MYVHVRLVWAVVDAVPLVVVDLRAVLSGIYLGIIRNRAVLVQWMRLYKLLMLLLDLQVLW